MLTFLPNEIARREGGEVVFSDQPVRLSLGPFTVHCADQHDVRVVVHCTLTVRAQSVDRQAFANLLLRDRPVVTRQDVADYFSPVVESAVRAECEKLAANLVADGQREALLDRLRRSLDAAAFEAGIVLLPPLRLDVDSPSLQIERQQQAERARAADSANEQLKQVRHAADVLKQFDSLREASSAGGGGSLLEQIAPADRASVLLATLAARAAEAPPARIVVVAGSVMLRIDADPARPSITPIPELLGPLRSVRSAIVDGKKCLLIGARSGVWIIDAADPASATAYHDRSLQSSLGFNSAAISMEGRLYATHADGGLVCWELGKNDAPVDHSAASGARQLQLLPDGSIGFVSGSSIEWIERSERSERGARSTMTSISNRPIVALLSDAMGSLVVHEDGSVGRFNQPKRQIESLVSFAAPVNGAALLPWVGTSRMLLSRDAGYLECVGLNDSVVHRYRSPYSGALRSVAAQQSMIVAVTNDRQRLLSWSPGDGSVPKIDLNITSLTRHRIADVALF